MRVFRDLELLRGRRDDLPHFAMTFRLRRKQSKHSGEDSAAIVATATRRRGKGVGNLALPELLEAA